MLENFSLDFGDKIGDFFVMIAVGGIAWMYRLLNGTVNRLDELDIKIDKTAGDLAIKTNKVATDLALKVAENYVTKPELQRVEDKIDTMGNKIDTINQNIILLLTNK